MRRTDHPISAVHVEKMFLNLMFKVMAGTREGGAWF